MTTIQISHVVSYKHILSVRKLRFIHVPILKTIFKKFTKRDFLIWGRILDINRQRLLKCQISACRFLRRNIFSENLIFALSNEV